MSRDRFDVLERFAPLFDTPEPSFEGFQRRRDRKRRNQRIAAGVVGIAVFVAAIWVVTTGLPFDQSRTEVVPGGEGTGPAETGPVETRPAQPIVIGTVTQSGAGCALRSVTDPIAPGAGRLSLVNETNGWVSFELYRFDPEVLTFAQFEAIVAEGEYWGPHPQVPPGTFVQVKREVGPDASGTIIDNLTTGAFAVVCLDQHHLLETDYDYLPFALVGPIVVTGPTQTGPTETGPTETGPAATDAGWDGVGLPPEDAVPSTPVEGEIVAEFGGWVLEGAIGWVYADGRVIWSSDAGGWVLNERRLTPDGVELVRSGAIAREDAGPPWVHYPASAWADPESRRYVPPRYAICYADGSQIVDPSSVAGLLPAGAEALLRGKEQTYENATLEPAVVDPAPSSTCFEVTTEEARALDEILSDAGFRRSPSFDGVAYRGPVGGFGFSPPTQAAEAGSIDLIEFAPLLPHGKWGELCRTVGPVCG